MRIPPNWPMALVLVMALGAVVMILIFAIQEPPGDRTRFTVEQSQARVVGQSRLPILAEESALGR